MFWAVLRLSPSEIPRRDPPLLAPTMEGPILLKALGPLGNAGLRRSTFSEINSNLVAKT